jgi:lysophospholipase L1-like esterase
MAARRRAAKRTSTIRSVSTAVTRGRRQADLALEDRARRRRRRARAVAAGPARARRAVAARARIPARTARMLRASAPAVGLLLAEGDSWFDYPMHNVLKALEDLHGYDVESCAHHGDWIEHMAYAQDQFDPFTRCLEKLLRQGRVPDAILLSGGGNDIAGDAFGVFLDHAASGLPAVNADVVRGVIDVRLRHAYTFMIAGLTKISRHYLGRPIPIVTHGYDYPVPDGRGFLGGWGPLPGPWLRPGFHRKGHGDPERNRRVMRDMIDAFNVMLAGVARAPSFGHVRHVDLRGTLRSDGTYRRDWGNELHPTGPGYEAVTAKIAGVIARL